MSDLLRLLILGLIFVLTACGSKDTRRRADPPECRRAEDCLLATVDGGGIVPACRVAACIDRQCTTLPVDEGTKCDDGDEETIRDACSSARCKGEPATCTERAGPCKKATLDPATNECTLTNLADGTGCNDEDLCTETDSCEAGKCVGKSPVVCEAKDECHVAGECDPKTGKCDDPNADDGTTCDDALKCTENDACEDGKCKGADVVCDDGLACSKDSCDESVGGCQVDMSACACETSETCNDGNACNGVEACNSATGLCELGTAKDCSAKSDACHRGTCNQASGECAATPVDDGLPCDDSSLCTGTDTCQAGVCTGKAPVICTALDGCHAVGTCDARTGSCSNPTKPDGTSCDDSKVCTLPDTCTAGVCGGTAKACTDGIACSVDGCSETAGGCTFNTATCGCIKDSDCNDGNACNGVETCSPTTFTCRTGTAVSCAAMDDACNTGTCNAADGKCTAVPRPNGIVCADGNACTQFDSCQAGKCGGTALTCPVPDQCHNAGTCNPASGVCSNPAKTTGTTCNDGLACTTGDACNAAGACAGAARVCNDAIACTVDSCSEAIGGCTTDRTACGCAKDADCNDGNACNGVETCNLATLTCRSGTAVNCTAQTNACNLGTCNPTTGACSAVPRPNGTTCTDSLLCTTGDACQSGTCVGTAVTCPAPDQCHDTRTCDPANGTCTNPAKTNGVTCNDGKSCTTLDVCTSGTCGGAALGCADTIACTVDSCVEPSGCAHNTTACQCTKNSDCNDGNACNGVEMCDLTTLSCKGGTAVNCGGLTDACNTGTCAPATGECSAVPKTNGTTCNDGALCTTGDSCQAGRCTGSAVVCPAADQCHNTRSCDPATGACTNPSKANGTPCNDGLFCTTPDTCTAGVCGGTAVACNDGIACTVDACTEVARGCTSNTAACECTADAKCSDGNACNGVETCNLANYTCRTGTPVDCSGQTNGCNVGTCNTTTGACSAVPRPNGTTCSDSQACTTGDACQAGACVGAAVTCPTPDQCHTAGTCNPSNGTCSNPIKTVGTTCNDGLACTTGDACNAAGACTGPARVCNDGIACTVDSCSEASAGCTTDRSACGCARDADCNDGNACNGVETCDLATLSCRTGTAVSCAAQTNACNVGTCNTTTGACTAVPRANGTTCTDSLACTTGDACQAGACVGTAITCPTPDQCHTAGTCNPSSGVCSNPIKTVGTTCNDGFTCTTGDACNAAGACAGAARVCNDGIACTVDSCSEASGGCIVDRAACQCARDSDCNDNNACNGVETCDLATFSCSTGTAVNCSAQTNACNVGTCNPSTGACAAVPRANGTTCNDSLACTTGDACQAGACVGTAITCPTPDQCHTVGTCNPSSGVCSNPIKTVGTTCNDGLACTTTDACNAAGACAGAARVCNDGIACTVDSCSEASGGCVVNSSACGCARDADCNDSNACNGVETCDLPTLSCRPGTAVDCSRFNAACTTGTCNTSTGACSASPKPVGTACNDGNACTATDGCNAAGACAGSGTVTCTQPANQCQVATCVAPGGCQTGTKPDSTPCNDGNVCTSGDICRNGTCSGQGRDDTIGDWGDDPSGTKGVGPYSVDLMTYSDGHLAAVGMYSGNVDFAGVPLAFDTDQTQMLYLAQYEEDGSSGNGKARTPVAIATTRTARAVGEFVVAGAAMHPDDSFTVIGTINGQAEFGLKGATTPLTRIAPAPFVARFEKDGAIRWLVSSQVEGTLTLDAVASVPDGATIVAGTNLGTLMLIDRGGQQVTVPSGGAWAARIEADGTIKYARRVAVAKDSASITVRGVTGHSDNSYSLLGLYAGSVVLGPKSEKTFDQNAGGLDAWFLRLESDAAYRFGGRLGATGNERAGAIQGGTNDSVAIAVDVVAQNPVIETVASGVLALHSSTISASQTELILLDKDGKPASASLIGGIGRAGSVNSYALGLGKDGTFTMTGVYQGTVTFYDEVGFAAGAPSTAGSVSLTNSALALFVSRHGGALKRRWTVEAGGVNSGMLNTGWDLVEAVHPSGSVTVGGMFQAQSTFGVALPKLLTPTNGGSPFVTHIDSRLALDPCP